MTALPLTTTPSGRAGFINPANTGVSGRTITHVGISDSTLGVQAGVLAGEFKRLTTFAGQAVADDTIHITIRDDSDAVYSMRAFALYLDDGTILTWYAQDDAILQKSSQAMLLLSADMQLTGVSVTELQFGDANWTNPIATTQVYGVLRIATDSIAQAGLSVTDAITPSGLKAVLNDRLGAGAPSPFFKGLLALGAATAVRAALELGTAATRNSGAGNGLDADLLDGQHGAYYLSFGNLTGVPSSFPPSAHGHAWGDLSGVPSTASRWPTFDEVTGKPSSYPPGSHTHSTADITSGTFDVARLPQIAINKVTGLQGAIDGKASKSGEDFSGPISVAGVIRSNYFAGQNGNGAVQLGSAAAPQVINGHSWAFDFSHTRGWTATLESGGVIWTSQNFRPDEKANLSGADFKNYLQVTGELRAKGASSALWFEGRDNTRDFAWYSMGGTARLASGLRGASTTDILTVSAGGAVNALGGFDFGSSIKLKHIDGPLPYGLSEVVRMRTAAGRYRSDYNADGRRRLFLLAEDLAELVPEAVDAEGVEFNGQMLPTIKIEQLLPVFANAIKELAAELHEVREALDGIIGEAR